MLDREQHTLPHLRSLTTWPDELRPQAAGNTARAMDYPLRRWDALALYVDDGAHR